MSTTVIFVELLIAGIQASIWIVLLIISALGFNWIFPLTSHLEKWSTLVTVIIFAFWYTVGIIVDRFADGFFKLLNPKSILKKSKLFNIKRLTDFFY